MERIIVAEDGGEGNGVASCIATAGLGGVKRRCWWLGGWWVINDGEEGDGGEHDETVKVARMVAVSAMMAA
jgi:hypothetical protein